MDLERILRHLMNPHWAVRRAFPTALLEKIGQAVTASEQTHGGELRFALEGGLELSALLRGQTARERAVELFSRLRVWDTELNCGVLIYVQCVDRKLEIVADRGIAARVAPEEWRAICRRMEQAFRQGEFEAGSLSALDEIGRLLQAHFPARGSRPNELPDQPLVL
ncbi:MAG: TPM domain-containing protein [Rhodocyclaceae bacterium]|nr:TPM domain-containing protein [Rhodocyclaceae bacterium]